MNFNELTEKLTQQGIDLKQYRKYLNHLYKHADHLVPANAEQSDSTSDIIFEVSAELQTAPEKQDSEESTIESVIPTNQRFFAKTEKLPITKPEQLLLADTEPMEPVFTISANEESTLAFEKISEEMEDLKRVCIQLLIRSKMEIVEINELLRSIPADQRNARALLQHLLKKKKIRIDECFELEQGQWLPSPQQEKIPFNFKILNGCPEFFLTEKLTQQKFGHYQIIRELARGGMGIVYKVYHPGLAQYFALKVLIAGENASEETIRRFHREAKNTAKLKHPGIVQVIDSGEERGRHYFVMEYVEGQTFGQFLKKRPPLREGLLVMKKALEALHFAHTQGIIHRDIKPENIFITQEGHPKIGDFGLAKNVEIDGKSFKITHSGAILGTPAYMSPEQAAGQIQDVDERTDVYSMGACLYQLLTQKIPFEAETLHKQLHLIINDEPLPPSKILPDIHKDVDVMILKSLEKQKVKRYASALEFAEDIGRFLAGYPIQARPSSRKEHLLKAIKRNQQAFTVGFLLTTLFLGTTLYFQWRRYQENQEVYSKAETAFQQLFQKIKTELQFMEKVKSDNASQQMHHGLNALKIIKRASLLKPNESELRKHQIHLMQQLIPLACQLESYSLAEYLLEEMIQLPGIEKEQKESYSFLIEEEKKKLHEQHFKEFLHGVNQLRSELSTELEREAILLRLCQWKEPKIFTKLQEILQEATEYFLSDRKRETLSTDFYFTMLRIIAHQASTNTQEPFFTPILLQEIERMSFALLQSKIHSNSEDLYYLILLTQTLSWIPKAEGAEAVQKIRLKFGKESLYWRQTESAYQRLQQHQQSSTSLDSTPSEETIPSTTTKITPEISSTTNTPKSVQEQRLLQSGLQKINQADFTEALKDLEEVLKLNPNHPTVYYYRGWAYQQQKNYTQAIQEFTQTLQLRPQMAEAYHNRGMAYYKLGQIKEAFVDLDESIHLDPQNAFFYRNRGIFLLDQEKLPESLNDFNATLQINENDALAYFYRGQVKSKLKQWNEAIEDYNRSLQISPKEALVWFHKGFAYQKLEQWNEAIMAMETGLQIQNDPQMILALGTLLLQRAQHYSQKKDIEKAIEDVRAFLKRIPSTHTDYSKAQEFLTSLQKQKK